MHSLSNICHKSTTISNPEKAANAFTTKNQKEDRAGIIRDTLHV
jgi:hypothetical protein